MHILHTSHTQWHTHIHSHTPWCRHWCTPHKPLQHIPGRTPEKVHEMGEITVTCAQLKRREQHTLIFVIEASGPQLWNCDTHMWRNAMCHRHMYCHVTEVLRPHSLPLPDNIPVLILEVLHLNKLLCVSSDFKFNKHRALATDLRAASWHNTGRLRYDRTPTCANMYM